VKPRTSRSFCVPGRPDKAHLNGKLHTK
jgi:hypothetical protein